jgi:hypothetical protein
VIEQPTSNFVEKKERRAETKMNLLHESAESKGKNKKNNNNIIIIINNIFFSS